MPLPGTVGLDISSVASRYGYPQIAWFTTLHVATLLRPSQSREQAAQAVGAEAEAEAVSVWDLIHSRQPAALAG